MQCKEKITEQDLERIQVTNQKESFVNVLVIICEVLILYRPYIKEIG